MTDWGRGVVGNHVADDRDDVDGPSNGDRARPRKVRRILIALGATVVVALVIAGGAGWYITERYAGNLERIDGVFADLDAAERPAAPTESESGRAPLTFLVVGSDTRAEVASGELPDGRSDVMMLLRFTGDRTRAQVVSLPRDSWVTIPGVGPAKLNAAYAYGGPSLLVQTVESMTGVRIDHYAAIDFQGFVQMTDALGGVEVQVAATTSTTTETGTYTYHAGLNELDGQAALQYVRQRHELPGGDIDRAKRQQEYLRSMFTKLSQQDVLGDASALDGFLIGLTSAMSVDEQLSNGALLELAYELRTLSPGAVTFLTAPVAGTGREGSQSVVYLDEARSELMWGYLQTDSLGEHPDAFGTDTLPAVPN
jgi:LCP family protein required for cell wall assembly